MLQSTDWTWNFGIANDGLHASIRAQTLTLPAAANDLRLCAIAGESITQVESPSDDAMRIAWGSGAILYLQLAGNRLNWRFASARPVRVEFPYWSALYIRDSPDVIIRTERSFQDANDLPIIRYAEYALPATCIGADETALTLLMDQGLCFDDLVNGAALEADKSISGSWTLHKGGWRAAFSLLRDQVRPQVDLSEYQRQDLDWYQNQWVQHFTFLYGREILNLKTHRFELERFIAESQRDFGGYDGMLLWGGYPRLGIDERTQWDYFDDLPGGRSELRSIVDLAHAHGIRVFVPYKPWDRSSELHGHMGKSAPEELARLISEIDADGVFLDTMSAIDPAFRESIDALRPGVVFCSEGRVRQEAFEIITGSWDQSPTRDWRHGNWSAEPERMPGIDLKRFIFPEHRLFVINRHAVGDDRMKIIMRGFFGGTGWVVWQDIFGLVLTYSPEEAALLKKCRLIFQAHEQALHSDAPTPLLPTLIAGVYCNEFASAQKRLWTFYNDTDQAIDGCVLQIDARPDTHFIDFWNNLEVSGSDGCLRAALKPYSVGAIVELPRLIAYEANTQTVQLRESIEDTELRVIHSDSQWVYPVKEQLLPLPNPVSSKQIIFQLLRGTEILDQLIWTAE
jgi:hypothetical protein